MTLPEDLAAHAKVLSESYDVPLDTMTTLLTEGGIIRLSAGRRDPDSGAVRLRCGGGDAIPKQTFVLDVVQFAEAEQTARARSLSLLDAARTCFIGRCLTN